MKLTKLIVHLFFSLPSISATLGFLMAAIYESHVELMDWICFSIVAGIPVYSVWCLYHCQRFGQTMEQEEFV